MTNLAWIEYRWVMNRSATILAFAILVFSPPLAAQNREPKTYLDCDALYERELKKYASQTNRDLRETQSKASISRKKCERAVERQLLQARAKGKR
jgi:hypothetical protein